MALGIARRSGDDHWDWPAIESTVPSRMAGTARTEQRQRLGNRAQVRSTRFDRPIAERS
ncbi:hypothetical protein D3C80_1706560 [compost metagenome]